MAIVPAQILTNIIMFVQTLNFVNNGIYKAWETRTFDFNQRDDMAGVLTIDNAQVSLVMGPYETFKFASVVADADGNFKACINSVTFPSFNLTFEYFADVAIIDKYPVYGTGSYHGRLTNISTTFCWLLSQTAEEILDFDIKVDLRHGPSQLTGFFNNDELNPITETYLTLAKRLFAMWNNYEPECARKCILNPAFFFMTNYLIYDINKAEEITWEECSCVSEKVHSGNSELELDELLKLDPMLDPLLDLIETVSSISFR
ncbi:unnamed protein product [Ceutorhynchus assimilis]|uniref:Uncharacterized protein n=1 Tax=Ceutorhynchus assimilis TaxID=467358 RepID=A0A9P0DLM7_9CUCU|nr:unnamed protein product [Ceutorhynchus assimilis]